MVGTSTRERILEEGLRLFIQSGYSATGIKSIVDAAEVPKGSFYHFFPEGKEGFALAVVDLYASTSQELRTKLLLTPKGSPLERLKSYFEHYAAHFRALHFREGCLLGNLSAEAVDVSERLRVKIDAAFNVWEADLAAVLEEASAAGEIPCSLQARLVARYLINGWEGALLRMKAEKSEAALVEFISATFEIFLSNPKQAPTGK